MPTVVQIITTLARGGAQRTALDLATRLHRPDRAQLLISGVPGVLDDEARRRLGARFLKAPALDNEKNPFRDLAALDQLHKLLSKIAKQPGARPLVVHTHSIKAGLLGRMAARAVRGVRVVHMLHGFAFDVFAPAVWLERVAAMFGDVQLFVSEADRQTAQRLGIGPLARSLIVRSGIEPEAFQGAALDEEARARTRAELGLGADVPVAVTVANMKPQKDPLFHVEILRRWQEVAAPQRPRLVFLGAGPLEDDMQNLAARHGVDELLLRPGAVPDARPYLAAADAMLLASKWEGLPRSVLEGLLAGLPIVVRDPGWGADLDFAPLLQRLPPDEDASSFAEALQHAVDQPRVPIELPKEFTLDGMLAQLDELYDLLLFG